MIIFYFEVFPIKENAESLSKYSGENLVASEVDKSNRRDIIMKESKNPLKLFRSYYLYMNQNLTKKESVFSIFAFCYIVS